MAEPIAIYSLPTDTHLNFKQEVNLILEKSGELDPSLITKAANGSGTFHIGNRCGQCVFNSFDSLSPLKTIILECAHDFICSIGYQPSKCFISDAWLNMCPPGASLEPHLHSNSFISGTYYSNFDSSIHSTLKFINDRIASLPSRPLIMLPSSDNLTPYNTKNIAPPISEGDIVFWKSHLIHGYEQSQAPGRVTLSFNIMPEVCTDGDQYAFRASPY